MRCVELTVLIRKQKWRQERYHHTAPSGIVGTHGASSPALPKMLPDPAAILVVESASAVNALEPLDLSSAA